MFCLCSKVISKDYGKKFRVLQSTLLAPENMSLRSKIVNGDIDPKELTTLSTD
jgi:Transcription factor S-II (TFIIS), central domain